MRFYSNNKIIINTVAVCFWKEMSSMFSIFNTLLKYHFWCITENHGSCSCIVFSSFFSLSLFHRSQTHPNPTFLLSALASPKRERSFSTHHLERVKIKKTQRAVSLCSGEKTHSVTATILSEITVGIHSPSYSWIFLASTH